MREILYRGKQPRAGFVYGSLIKCGDYCCILPDDDGEGYDSPYLDNDTGCIDGYALPVNPETVGQFTGLTDKNGKRIFEGDIVQYIESDRGGDMICTDVVKFINGGFSPISADYNCEDDYYSRKYHSFEIIGNIHDCPKLLEVPEDG